MPKTEYVKARIDPETKREAKKVLTRLGLGVSEAINIYFAQIALRKGLPFNIEIPNEETLKAFQEINRDIAGKEHLKRYDNLDNFFEDMKSDC